MNKTEVCKSFKNASVSLSSASHCGLETALAHLEDARTHLKSAAAAMDQESTWGLVATIYRQINLVEQVKTTWHRDNKDVVSYRVLDGVRNTLHAAAQGLLPGGVSAV